MPSHVITHSNNLHRKQRTFRMVICFTGQFYSRLVRFDLTECSRFLTDICLMISLKRSLVLSSWHHYAFSAQYQTMLKYSNQTASYQNSRTY